MAEIVGVAATAAQLGMTCLSLLDLIKKIKEGSSTLEKYNQQLQELHNLSDSISQNPLLQTAEVGLHTEHILSIIEGNCLHSLLKKGRYQRILGLLYRERDIVSSFADLERQKTNLCLAIENIQAKALHQIQIDIGAMSTFEKSKKLQLPSQAMSSDSVSLLAASGDSNRSAASQIQNAADKHSVCGPNGIPSWSPNQDIEIAKMAPTKYYNIHADPGVHQINGPTIHLPPGTRKNRRVLIEGHSFYNNIGKYGEGVQLNGTDMVDHGYDHDVIFPMLPITYANIWFKAGPVLQTGDARCFQRNGGCLRPPGARWFNEPINASEALHVSEVQKNWPKSEGKDDENYVYSPEPKKMD